MDAPQNPLPSASPRRFRLVALGGLFVGCVAAFSGVALTIFFAYTVWSRVQSADDHPDARQVAAMKAFFDSMNHLAAFSVAMTLCGTALIIGSNLALSRKRKPPAPALDSGGPAPRV